MPDPIPAGHHSLTPNLIVSDGAAAIDYYGDVFGATVEARYDHGGKVMHAELRIGDSPFCVADELPDWGMRAPGPDGPWQGSVLLYCEDVDAVFERALAAGATEIAPVKDEFHGDRVGSLRCPFGHRWLIATHVEDVDPDEVQRRMEEWIAESAAAETASAS